jgi:hypothetical protein
LRLRFSAAEIEVRVGGDERFRRLPARGSSDAQHVATGTEITDVVIVNQAASVISVSGQYLEGQSRQVAVRREQ